MSIFVLSLFEFFVCFFPKDFFVHGVKNHNPDQVKFPCPPPKLISKKKPPSSAEKPTKTLRMIWQPEWDTPAQMLVFLT